MKLRYLIVVLFFSSTAMASLEAPEAVIGKLIFNDQSLSEPSGQSCSSCHRADAFHADPDNIVSPGANPALFGNRNAPSISYVKFNPPLYRDEEEDHWVGGFFLDGREKSLRDQADKPLFNPLEMGNTSAAELREKLRQASYAPLLKSTYGMNVFDSDETTLQAIRSALASYESGPEFAPFSSKYDHYLRGEVTLSILEQRGLEVYEDTEKGNCAACHPSQPGDDAKLPLFTDHTYDNLGLPHFRGLPFLEMPTQFNPEGERYKDPGLGENPHIYDARQQRGKFKVTTLRNIAQTMPYMHNGMFQTLEEVLDFYNTRDTDSKWAEPEFPDTVNREELGDLQLSDDDIQAIIAFLNTLSDGYRPTTAP